MDADGKVSNREICEIRENRRGKFLTTDFTDFTDLRDGTRKGGRQNSLWQKNLDEKTKLFGAAGRIGRKAEEGTTLVGWTGASQPAGARMPDWWLTVSFSPPTSQYYVHGDTLR